MKSLMEKVKRGEYRILRVDGSEQLIEERPTLKRIQQIIGASTLDSVCLDNPRRARPEQIMMVDDTGMIDHKPANPKATELYHAICKPGTVYAIHGDVVIVNDKDFA
jgi:hypothetical protein